MPLYRVMVSASGYDRLSIRADTDEEAEKIALDIARPELHWEIAEFALEPDQDGNGDNF